MSSNQFEGMCILVCVLHSAKKVECVYAVKCDMQKHCVAHEKRPFCVQSPHKEHQNNWFIVIKTV